MSFYTRFRLLSLAMIAVLLLAGLTQIRTLPAVAAVSVAAPTATPVAPTTPEVAVVVVRASANIRSGPGTTYQLIGGAAFDVTERIALFAQARYRATEDVETEVALFDANLDIENRATLIEAGVRFRF